MYSSVHKNAMAVTGVNYMHRKECTHVYTIFHEICVHGFILIGVAMVSGISLPVFLRVAGEILACDCSMASKVTPMVMGKSTGNKIRHNQVWTVHTGVGIYGQWCDTCTGGQSNDLLHYNDVIMSAMASQITSLTIVYSTVYSGADLRKHQSSASLAFVRGIHRWPVNSPHKGPVVR